MKKIFLGMLSLLLMASLSSASLIDGLVAAFNFEGNTFDSSGRGNDGVAAGGVSYGTGLFGSAAYFDGVNDYIHIGTNGYNLNQGSISMWIKSYTATGTVFTQYGQDFDRLKVHAGDEVRGYSGWGTQTLWLTQNVAARGVDRQDWHHVVFNYNFDLDQYTLFLNGVQVASSTVAYTPPTVLGEIVLGTDKDFDMPSPYYFNFFQGAMDNVRIYNRVLSSSEVAELAYVPEPSCLMLLVLAWLWYFRKRQ